MANSLNKCSANETAACCCVDVGSIIDNEDCKASFSREFAVRQQAESMLATLTEKACAVESDPCQINARIEPRGTTVSCWTRILLFLLSGGNTDFPTGPALTPMSNPAAELLRRGREPFLFRVENIPTVFMHLSAKVLS